MANTEGKEIGVQLFHSFGSETCESQTYWSQCKDYCILI